MAREPQPHPETNQIGETIEFEPIPPPEYVWLEATRDDEIRLEGPHGYPVEIRIGQTAETRPFFLESGGAVWELLKAAGIQERTRDSCFLLQPDVMEKDPRRGWAIIPYGETISVGRAETPQFQLGRDIARKGHMQIEYIDRQSRHEMRIEACTDNPIKVRVNSDFMYIDHRVHW